MRRRTKIILAFAVVVGSVLLSRPIIEMIPHKYDTGNTPSEHLSAERVKIMNPDGIVELLNPPPNSTILDIGAGYGLFTFPLARAAGTSSKIFATDIESQVIAYLTETAGKQGLTNVVPIQVSSIGVDNFYTQNSFDVILASDVLPDIVMPEGFIRKLRPSLKQGTGRFWVVLTRPDPDFTVLEFKESVDLLGTLRSRKVQSTIASRLSKTTNMALANQQADIDQITALVIADLNKLLEDPTLWPEAQTSQWPMGQRNAVMIEALSQLLTKQGTFNKGSNSREIPSKPALRLLNRLVLMDLLDLDLWGKATAFAGRTERDAKYTVGKLAQPADQQSIVALFRSAGYRLVKKHNATPYCYVFEFAH